MGYLLAHWRKKSGELNTNHKLLYSDRVVEIGRSSVNSIHATHYLKFSVKITTNQLHFHFRKKAPYIRKEVSELKLLVIDTAQWVF